MEETVQKKYVACCITALMYPICGATLNFRLNPFLSFVLDDMVPEFFLFADTMASQTAASNARTWLGFYLGCQVIIGAFLGPPRATGAESKIKILLD